MIETKYSINDKVFYLDKETSKIMEFDIGAIKAIRHSYNPIDTTGYCNHHQGSGLWLEEKYLFKTKEELIKSL
jgi:hypothetical protein